MDFDFSVITDHWRFLASGVGITLLLSVVSGLTSLLAGLVVALLRLYGPRPLRLAVVLYIDSMRAIPVLVVLVWSFFALPILTGITMPPFVAALVKIFGTVVLGAATDAAAAPSRVAARPWASPAVPSKRTEILAVLLVWPE